MAGFVEKKNSEKNVSFSFLHNHLSNHPPKRNIVYMTVGRKIFCKDDINSCQAQ